MGGNFLCFSPRGGKVTFSIEGTDVIALAENILNQGGHDQKKRGFLEEKHSTFTSQFQDER